MLLVRYPPKMARMVGKLCIFHVMFLFLFLLATGESWAKDSDEISVHIVPTLRDEADSASIKIYSPQQHFHVVVTNTGKSTKKLWREWCSWGYFNLSFESKDENGVVTKITKKFPGWDKNFPDWTLLPPGDSIVYEVNFDPEIWNNVPTHSAQGFTVVKLRAIFENDLEDTEGLEAFFKLTDVWAGRAVSNEQTYKIWR